MVDIQNRKLFEIQNRNKNSLDFVVSTIQFLRNGLLNLRIVWTKIQRERRERRREIQRT